MNLAGDVRRRLTLSFSVMKPIADPKIDYAFKHIFGRDESKPALTSLLNAVLQPVAGQNIQMAVHILELAKFGKSLDELMTSLESSSPTHSIASRTVARGGRFAGAVEETLVCRTG